MSHIRITAFAIVISICVDIVNSVAAILNVPEDYQTIQAGIANGNDGDTILVQPGIYQENILFNNRPVIVGSLLLTTGDPAYIDSTVIDGGGESMVVTFMPRNRGSVLRGFTIQNGRGGFGGGLYCRHESAETMEDLVVRDNQASISGGGLYCNTNVEAVFRRIKFIDNSAGETGGGSAFLQCRAVVEECEFTGNSSPSSGAIYATGSVLSLSRVSITANSCNEFPVVAIFNPGQDRVINLDHLTINGNRSEEETNGRALGIYAEEGFNDVVLTNSIIWNNGGFPEIALVNVGGNRCRLTASYNDIQGDRDEIAVGDGCQLVWGDGNIVRDPLFVDPDNGDYHISRQSPCVDTGDPEYEPDPDGSRTDIGRFALDRPDITWFGGTVTDWFDNPISGAVVIGNFAIGEDFQAFTDEEGLWGDTVYYRRGTLVSLNYEAAGYHSYAMEQPLDSGPDDQTLITVRLHQSRFEPSIDSLDVSVRLSESCNCDIAFTNSGDAATQWTADVCPEGEPGLPMLSIRDELAVGEITNDDRVEGVIFTGERYYVARANEGGADMISIFNRQGQLRGSFRQPDTSGYGFRDLAWDGELIWGCNNGFVWGISTIGEVVCRFPDPVDGAQFVAYDPRNQLLWVSGTTTRLQAIDRNGQPIGGGLDRQGLRIYGLAWLDSDPDSASLYILNKPANSPSRISKMNVTTGELLHVGEIGEIDESFKGLFISSDFDQYYGSVAITILNQSLESGGDILQVRQLIPNSEWLTVQPSSGNLLAGQHNEISIGLRTIGSNGSWQFDEGIYEGFIRFTTDAREGNFDIPVRLTVGEVAVDNPKENVLPVRTEILAIYPQPFNSTLTIDYTLDKPSNMRLALFDPTGRLAVSSTIDNCEAGIHRTNLSAGNLAAGVYLLKFEAGETTSTRKVVLLK